MYLNTYIKKTLGRIREMNCFVPIEIRICPSQHFTFFLVSTHKKSYCSFHDNDGPTAALAE